jgi:hypothetical protein
MADPKEPPQSWQSYELVFFDSDGNEKRPFSDDLARSSDRLQTLRIMSRVEDLGWPEAQKLTVGKKERKQRIVKKDDFIHLLKCTPPCWRFYFYVHEPTSRFVYVHGVCKKQDSENPGDAVTARQRYDKRASGGLRRIAFPS